MRISFLRSVKEPNIPLSRAELLLARKLQALATGLYPDEPQSIFRAQAQSLAEMPDVRHSVLASIEEVAL